MSAYYLSLNCLIGVPGCFHSKKQMKQGKKREKKNVKIDNICFNGIEKERIALMKWPEAPSPLPPSTIFQFLSLNSAG